jgi:hypothetical protein
MAPIAAARCRRGSQRAMEAAASAAARAATRDRGRLPAEPRVLAKPLTTGPATVALRDAQSVERVRAGM